MDGEGLRATTPLRENPMTQLSPDALVKRLGSFYYARQNGDGTPLYLTLAGESCPLDKEGLLDWCCGILSEVLPLEPRLRKLVDFARG